MVPFIDKQLKGSVTVCPMVVNLGYGSEWIVRKRNARVIVLSNKNYSTTT